MSENTLSLREQLDAAQAENAKLKAQVKSPLTFKVGDKGGIVVSGIQRFPTTLYIDGWKTLLGAKEEILAFCEANTERCEEVTGAKRAAQVAAREDKAAEKANAKAGASGTVALTPAQVNQVNLLLAKGVDPDTAIKAAKMLA